MIDKIKIRKELENLSEEKYKKFTSSLIPNTNNIIGVRIPNIRKLAKLYSKENPNDYLFDKNEIYFEEKMLKGLIIGNLNEDINSILFHIENFIPKIDNWSICDSFCNELKIIKKHKTLFWNFIKKYYKSDKPYEIRFAVVIILSYYIEEEYIDKIFIILDSIKREDYYVKMVVAWAISMCFIKYPDKTLNYLNKNKLDKETYNKALQKIIESRRVSQSTKDKIKSMKIKTQEVI